MRFHYPVIFWLHLPARIATKFQISGRPVTRFPPSFKDRAVVKKMPIRTLSRFLTTGEPTNDLPGEGLGT